jgi:putative ABC transport system ATP-binding protein
MLEGRNLRKTYRLSRRNSVEALAGVDIDIEAGEIVAIMGPSGSGKSTLMHILGLLHTPDRETQPRAELRIDGRDMTRLSDRDRTRMRASEMGFVFQSFNLMPTLTALENVALAAEYAGVPGRTARSKAREALAAVGLAERADHRPMELSGGEQQRVAISRSLVNEPKLLMADEPTGNLDTRRSAEVLGMLRRLNEERGQTIVLVTHDPEVGAASDRIVRMRDGLIVGDETRAPAAVVPETSASVLVPAFG